jgi:microcystin-dependent protein
VASPFLSEIKLFAFNFPPKGWAFCNGQLLPINQNQALFALLGTTYGGDGRVNFALPNLQGRVPISMGQGAGLQNYTLGQTGGVETVTLSASQIPSHTHTVDPTQLKATMPCKNGVATQRGPVSGVPAVEASGVTATYSTATPDASESTAAVTPTINAANTGGSQPHINQQPYAVLSYCIALQGIFPSQT